MNARPATQADIYVWWFQEMKQAFVRESYMLQAMDVSATYMPR
jgi:hypothetical protein